jgi:hypothetical protein
MAIFVFVPFFDTLVRVALLLTNKNVGLLKTKKMNLRDKIWELDGEQYLRSGNLDRNQFPSKVSFRKKVVRFGVLY